MRAEVVEARGEQDTIVEEQGSRSIQDWVQVDYAVRLGYEFAERGEGGGSVDSERAEGIGEIKHDKSIPERRKEQLIAMLEQQMAQISQLRPPAGNIEVVMPYAEQIKQIVDSE